MGASNQIIVFSFFGEKYLNQFKVCAQTIPQGWAVAVITDQDYHDDRFKIYKVNTPETEFDKFSFRKRIPDFIDINSFGRVWHCDCDVLFTGDLLAKYSDPIFNEYIIVSDEPMTSIGNEHMGRCFTSQRLQELLFRHEPAINSGLIGVSKSQSKFWGMYRELVNKLYNDHPDILFPDQQILNLLYHDSKFKFALTDIGDIGFPTRGTRGELMNHYIGAYIGNKDKVMEADL